MKKPLRCRIGWHKYERYRPFQPVVNWSGSGCVSYERCTRCGKEKREVFEVPLDVLIAVYGPSIIPDDMRRAAQRLHGRRQKKGEARCVT